MFKHNSGAWCRENARLCLDASPQRRHSGAREGELRCAIAHGRIHNPRVAVRYQTLLPGAWIPGLHQEAHPGMTAWAERACFSRHCEEHSRRSVRRSFLAKAEEILFLLVALDSLPLAMTIIHRSSKNLSQRSR